MDYARIALLFYFVVVPLLSYSQDIQQYDRFQLQEGELYWQNNFECPGKVDSIRLAVERMLQSRSFTFDVKRAKDGYRGKLSHYHVNPKQYGRTYSNTPKMYWDGEWSGNFFIEIHEGYYSVVVYDLQFKTETQAVGHYKPEKIREGSYVDAVTNNNKQNFLKSEFLNLTLMSVSLKDNFDIQYVVPKEEK